MSNHFEDQSLGRSFAIFVISLFSGIGGLFATAFLFDRMNWPYYHSWALVHGSGISCILFWAFVGYHITKLLFHSKGQLSPIPNLAYACCVIYNSYFLLRYDKIFLWLGIVLCSVGVYRRLRNRNKDAAGLMWAAFITSLASVSYLVYLKWAISSYVKSLK